MGVETKEITGTFEETASFQEKYFTLLDICDKEGSMVSQDRILEKDADIAPHRFFRKGTREYVFPKQEVTLKEDNSRTIDPSINYNLRAEVQAFDYDESAVKGKIKIEYVDAGNKPELKVLIESPKLPKSVQKTIDKIFT